MELLFREESCSFLTEKRYDLIYQELSAEAALPDSLPEIGQILDSFGTVIVQSRTAESGSVRVTGGIQAGVLYRPEDGGLPEKIEVWMPFTVAKKVPAEENTTLFYWGWIKTIEARFINAGKVLVRACLGSELTLLTPTEIRLAQLDRLPAGLECRTNKYPMRLPLAAAEKDLQIADEVVLEQAPGIDRLLKASCSVRIDESRCIGNKAVYKGDLVIKVLYLTENGDLSAQGCKVPFSQYAELDREIEDGAVTIQPILRHVEIDTDGQPDSRRLLLNIAVVAQIVVRGTVSLKLTEDAYSLLGELKPQWQNLELQPCLDILQRDLTQNLTLPDDVSDAVDVTVLTDHSEIGEDGALNGELRINILYTDPSGNLRSRQLAQSFHDAGAGEIPAGAEFRLLADEEAQRTGRILRIPMRADVVCLKKMNWRNLNGAELVPAERKSGPSLIVKAVSGDLWTLAKENGTTADAIRAANQLETDQLEAERLLLIPIGPAICAAEEG